MLINTNSIQANQILFSGVTDNSLNNQAMIDNISRTFNLSPSYFQVTKTLNGIEYPDILYDTWIMDQESYKEASSNKKIIMKPNQDLDRGDIINWNNQKWLTTNVDMQVFPYNEGVLEYCNDTLKCILPDGKLFETCCVITQISKKSMTIEKDGTVMESQKIPYFVTIQRSDLGLLIPLSFRFLFGKMSYKLEALDDISEKGLLIMMVTANQNRPNDDFVKMIADNNSLEIVAPVGNLIIDGSAKITTGSSQNYSVIYDNGSQSNGNFTFSISSTTNATLTILSPTSCSILGKVSSQVKLTALNTADNTTIFKILSIASSF